MAQSNDFICDVCMKPCDPFVVNMSVGVTPSRHRAFPPIDTVPGTALCREIHKGVTMRREFCLACFAKATGLKLLPAIKEKKEGDK